MLWLRHVGTKFNQNANEIVVVILVVVATTAAVIVIVIN